MTLGYCLRQATIFRLLRWLKGGHYPTFAFNPRWRYWRWLFVYVDHFGMGWDADMEWCYDDITWLWPWRRKDHMMYLSWSCGGTFATLADVVVFWEKYRDAMIANADRSVYDTLSAGDVEVQH